ncbi:MAG: ATP-dependent DNA helicase RecG [Bacteroidales bacterium]|nr:ATP-dependent DNA helicase RecG [Bacteroidales bacterium]
MQKLNIDSDITYLQGVGPKKAETLRNELNIATIKDLLYYFPYKHIDRSQFHKISEIDTEMPYIQLRGRILSFNLQGQKYKERLVAQFADETGSIELLWFKGIKWIQQNLKVNKEYIIFGKPGKFANRINIIHPEIEEPEQAEKQLTVGLQPVYSVPEKLKKQYVTTKVLSKLIIAALQSLSGNIPESLPDYLIQQLKFMPLNQAIKQMHFPDNTSMLKNAIARLKFEELFYIQIHLLKQKLIRQEKFSGFVFKKVGDKFNNFYHNNLPFELTGAQKKVIKEIRKDLGSGKQMNRLLQGDVGSGKTLVALMVMLIAIDNDYQCSLMAPTEILAKQHYKSISKLLEGLGVGVQLLTGSTKTKERKIIHKGLIDNEINILIGTHALIEDTVKFYNLGLVIIDEQHRFGVAQRAKLWKKNISPPHVLVMTATPIPRTLAMTLYGDLDVSIIDELPPGRKPVKTVHMFDSKRLRLFSFLKEQIKAGRQVYIVYPLIKESETLDYKDLEDGYESITRAFPPPEYTVAVVHGQMKADEKEKAMQLFVKGQAQIMVSTTVIEVGVDVPNATVMVIESAEKFGLSQLHQLRGRVGRGAEQSWCILMSSYKLSNEARKRIQTMVQSTDGFEIAEVDLKLRGPGDLEGTQQSGIAFNLKLTNLAKDIKILEFARNKAIEILKSDPKLKAPDNKVIAEQLKQKSMQTIQWGLIS